MTKLEKEIEACAKELEKAKEVYKKWDSLAMRAEKAKLKNWEVTKPLGRYVYFKELELKRKKS